MFWKTFGPTHMRSINHLYNACHIKKVTIWLWTSECVCCVKVGLISGQPPRFLLPPPSIYLGGPYMPAGACLNASWRVAAALFHGPHLHLLGRCQGRIWRTHSDICEVGVSDLRFRQKKTVNCASSDTVRVGIISQNHSRENWNLRPSSYWCVFGAAAHVGRTSGTRVSETQADQLLVIRPVPEISLLTRTAGRQRLAVEQNLIV